MLNVACVKVGTKYSADYVNILFDMTRRNLSAGFVGRFACFTDDATGLDPAILVKPVPKELASRGWWAKLYLFSEDAFPKGERVLYFDLDTAITGPLDEIAKYNGPFAILRDAYRYHGLQSAVMAWKAGDLGFIWDRFVEANYPEIDGGDQAFIEECMDGSKVDLFQEHFCGKFRSYKVECRNGIPRGTSVVFFHGNPRPHEITEGWVPEVWKVGGGSGLEFIVQANVSDDVLRKNAISALSRNCRWLEERPAHNGVACIIGGGPSLADTLFYIRGMQLNGAAVVATNNTYAYLKEHDIQADAHVLLDARQQNIEFVPDDPVPKFYASQCDASILDKAGDTLYCWHAFQHAYVEHIAHHPSANVQIGGGSTVGLRAIALSYVMGFRDFRLFGFDSSYRDSHHAYPQKLNDNERIVQAKVDGKTYKCAPWMVTQAEEFKDLITVLVLKECKITVYGEGMIQSIAKEMSDTKNQQTPHAELRASSLMEWLKKYEKPVGAEVGVFAGDLSKRLLKRDDLKLYLVDSWSAEHDGAYKDSGDFHANLTQLEQNHFLEVTKRAVAFAEDRAIIVRKPSVDAAKTFEDHSLDFVFIDADHSYEGCKADIEAWLPKIKKGGFISGHDYANDDPKFNFGVKRAVDEMFTHPILGENFTWKVDV